VQSLWRGSQRGAYILWGARRGRRVAKGGKMRGMGRRR